MQYMKYLEEAKEKTKKYEETMHCKKYFFELFTNCLVFSVEASIKGRIVSINKKGKPKHFAKSNKKG